MKALGKSLMDALLWVDFICFCIEAKKLHRIIPRMSEDSLVKKCRLVDTKLFWYVDKVPKQFSDGEPPSLLLVTSSFDSAW